MRTIIAGSRTIVSYATVERIILESGFEITHVLCGGAPGVDVLAELWAKQNKVPYTVIRAEWPSLGKAAGYERNRRMAEAQAEALIALWDGVSRGTPHMIAVASCMDLRVFAREVRVPSKGSK